MCRNRRLDDQRGSLNFDDAMGAGLFSRPGLQADLPICAAIPYTRRIVGSPGLHVDGLAYIEVDILIARGIDFRLFEHPRFTQYQQADRRDKRDHDNLPGQIGSQQGCQTARGKPDTRALQALVF